MASFCDSDIDTAIQSAIEVVGLEKLKDKQKKLEFVEGKDVFVLLLKL